MGGFRSLYGNQEYVTKEEYEEWVIVERARMRVVMRNRRAAQKAEGLLLPHYPRAVYDFACNWLDAWITRRGWISEWSEHCDLSDVTEDLRQAAHGARTERYDVIASRGVAVLLRARGCRLTRTGLGIVVRGCDA